MTDEQASLGRPGSGQKSQIGQKSRQKEQQRAHHGVVPKLPLTRAEWLNHLVSRELRRDIESGLGGTRTHNQRLKRALLYH